MPKDRRTSFGFVRQDKGHQEVATMEWQESGGSVNFVGEWHTHPERHPTPSWIDRRSWRRQMGRHKPVSLSETQSCWQLPSNRAMLLPYARGL
jgi:integrative and conjugative element protein (TIGR02256 family)